MSNAIMSGNIDQLELSVTGSSVHSSSSPSSSPSVETTRTPHASHPIPSWRNPDPWSEGGSSQYRIGVTVGSMGGRRYTRGDRPSILVSAERQRARGVGGHLRFPYMRDSSFLLLCFSPSSSCARMESLHLHWCPVQRRKPFFAAWSVSRRSDMMLEGLIMIMVDRDSVTPSRVWSMDNPISRP